MLAPGLRLGYVIAPRPLFPKLLQAKQAADLHTPGFNQRVVHEVIRDGFLRDHVPTIRARYKAQRDAMRVALERHFAGRGCRWTVPHGGMFFWVELPHGRRCDGAAAEGGGARRRLRAGRRLLRRTNRSRTRCACRSSPSSPSLIDDGIAALARVLEEAA